MGRRRRINTDQELPPRVYLHHGNYRYVPRFGNPVSLGRDYPEAMRKWALLKQPVSPAGSVAALIDWYLVNVAKKKGSSPNSGKRSTDLEEEVGVVAEAVGHALDALDQVGSERPAAMGEDARHIGFQVSGEGL